MFSLAWWLSLAVGFLSLSEEILWVRVVGFDFGGQPGAFSFVLTLYLVGIALGAAYGKRLCAHSGDLFGAAALVLAVAGLDDGMTPLVIGRLISPQDSLLILALAIVLTAGIKSALFPIVHHLGSDSSGPRVGRSMSRIYFGNIVGATLGPLVTGFIALDHLSVDQCFASAALICAALAAVALRRSPGRAALRPILVTAGLGCTVALFSLGPGPGSLAALAADSRYPMTFYAANRHGVIHTVRSKYAETIFGGNIYDGLTAVDVDRNANRLDRVYILGLIDDKPSRILCIGLSGGAWLRALEGFPGVESIDVVEINPAYLDLIRQRPELEPLLHDPRIHIHIDDGRRWLRRHPDAHFDAVVQNTTFHWRANAGNLLSREYFELLRDHLNPGGVLLSNTTGSFDVYATALSVFPHTYRYGNFVYVSDHLLAPNLEALWGIRRPDGTPFDATQTRPVSVVGRLRAARLEPADEFLARLSKGSAQAITDDNLLSEYRHGGRFELLDYLEPPPAPQFSMDDP